MFALGSARGVAAEVDLAPFVFEEGPQIALVGLVAIAKAKDTGVMAVEVFPHISGHHVLGEFEMVGGLHDPLLSSPIRYFKLGERGLIIINID